MKDTLVMDAFTQAYDSERPDKCLIVHIDLVLSLLLLIFRYYYEHMVNENALMESFYRTIKKNLFKMQILNKPEQDQLEIFKYIGLY